MTKLLSLPVGIENFEKLRENSYYYVDKTRLIELLLEQQNEITLFTRPRRFGKSLNMSMLKAFFEPGTDKASFVETYISQNSAICEKYMGKFPVISIARLFPPILRSSGHFPSRRKILRSDGWPGNYFLLFLGIATALM